MSHYALDTICDLLEQAAKRRDIALIKSLVPLIDSSESNGSGNGNGNNSTRQISLFDVPQPQNGNGNKIPLQLVEWRGKLKTQLIPHLLKMEGEDFEFNALKIKELLAMYPEKYPFEDVKGRLASALDNLKNEGYLTKVDDRRYGNYRATELLLNLVRANA